MEYRWEEDGHFYPQPKKKKGKKKGKEKKAKESLC